MPVKSAISNFKSDDFLGDMANFHLDHLSSTEFVLSDDIWKKFELPLGDGLMESALCELDVDSSMLTSLLGLDDLCEIRNHDCMWAGHCGSKEHPADELKNPRPLINPIMTASVKNAPVPPGRSLLLKAQNFQQTPSNPATTNTTTPLPSSLPGLDSPPNSDDEEVKVKTETLQLLQDAISECDLEDDSDLYDYFEDDELLTDDVEKNTNQEQTNVPSKTTIVSNANTATSDHCYHKDKNATMRMNNLGLETPSDSEEEIDVVSVGEKQTVISRLVCTLPNNPTSRDRHKLQRTMATAINNNGMKNMSRKSADLPMKSRGTKRSKHRSPPTSPYKKRSSYNHSSDSEPEPSEKRSLHNNMERQRRIDLRNAFEDLRLLVPEVSKRARTPKVVILREAAAYCDHLGDVSDDMLREVDELRRQQKRLRARVSQLRLSLAAKHR